MADINWADFKPAPAPDQDIQNLVSAITHVESGGDAGAVSSQGAQGSMQIMPATFTQYAAPGQQDFGNDAHRRSAAVRKIVDDYVHFGGDLAKTAASYIGGRGAVRGDGTIRDDVADANGTTPAAYADMVLGRIGKAKAVPAVDWSQFTPVKEAGAGRGLVNPDGATPAQAFSVQGQLKTATQPQAGGPVDRGPADYSDPLTRVTPSAQSQDTVITPIAAAPQAGGGRGFVNPPPAVNQQPVVESPREVGFAESAARGWGRAGAASAQTFNLAASLGGVVYDKLHSLISGKEETGAQDELFRSLVDPTQEAVNWYALQPDERSTFLGKVGDAVGAMAQDLPLMIASGGASQRTALAQQFPTIGRFLENAFSSGFDAMRPIMVKAGVEKAKQVLDAGGSVPQAVNSATTAAMLTGFQGGQPMSATGNLASRVATGVPVGMAQGESARVIQNAADPEGLQRPFDPAEMAAGGVTNAIAAGAMGHGVQGRVPDRIDLGYDPMTGRTPVAEAVQNMGEPPARSAGPVRAEPARDHVADIFNADTIEQAAQSALKVAERPVDAGDVAAELRSIRPMRPVELAEGIPNERANAEVPTDAAGADRPGSADSGAGLGIRPGGDAVPESAMEPVRSVREAEAGVAPVGDRGSDVAIADRARGASAGEVAGREAQTVGEGREGLARAEEILTRPTADDVIEQQRRRVAGAADETRHQAYEEATARAFDNLPDFTRTGSDRAADANQSERHAGVEYLDIAGDAARRQLIYQGYERAEVPRLQAARALNKLVADHEAGKIEDGRFETEVKILAQRMALVKDTKAANRITGERERGADLVREKLIRARRHGDLTNETVEFALWALDKNPALAEGLGLSLRTASDGNRGSAGHYSPVARIATLFKGNANDSTAVHEILHHTERMMPPEVQAGIASAWAKAFSAAHKDATPQERAVLDKMLDAMAGSQTAAREVHEAFAGGKLDHAHYQLTNASEFWAVNATRILQARHAAGGWVAKARQWLGEMVQKAKGVFGLASDAPVLRGLQEVLGADGTMNSRKMLSEAAAVPNGGTPRVALHAELYGTGGRSAGDSTPRERLEAARAAVAEVHRLAQENGTIYARWANNEKHDLSPNARSKDHQTGNLHEGLSAVAIDSSMSPARIATAIMEYGFSRIAEPNSKPRVYAAERVGEDSDGYDSVRPRKLLWQPSAEVLTTLHNARDVFKLEERLRDDKERLGRITDPIARRLVEDSQAEAAKQLDEKLKLFTNASVASDAFERSANLYHELTRKGTTPATDGMPDRAPGGKWERGKSVVSDLIDEGLSRSGIYRFAAPMSEGSVRARAVAQNFANAERLARAQWQRISDILQQRFMPEQRRKMFDAADEQNTVLQQGGDTTGRGLERLNPAERDAVEQLHTYGEELLRRAKNAGMFQGEGLPYWTPRMMVMLDQHGEYTRPTPESGKKQTSGGDGRNVFTTSSNLKQRKYLTAEETEAAMKAKGGELVRDIMTMPLAMARLERAIAGRELINQIRELGRATGEPTVASGRPDHEGWFTLDHSSFTTFQPRFERDAETGKMRALLDEKGAPVFDRVPLYMSKEFEGPIKAILSNQDGTLYRAFMLLKSKSMSAIMFSPLIHNLVIFGRALGYDPTMAGTVALYFKGYAAKKDNELYRTAIEGGMVPMGGHRGSMIDITDVARGFGKEGGWLDPQESWISHGAKAILGAVNKDAGAAAKRFIDNAGDFWHGTMLWDRVADLQMGIFAHGYERLQNEGYEPGVARVMAAHWANRYAGAVARENMGEYARKLANALLFSRSFNMGNLGTVKDIVFGLPSGLRAKIEAEYGRAAASKAFAEARRKAWSGFIADAAMSLIALSLAQSAVDRLKNEKGWDEIFGGYTERAGRMWENIKAHPANPKSYSPWQLSPTHDNEPGKEDRIDMGQLPDAGGRHEYMRLPTGKVVEDLFNWTSHFPTTFSSKTSPLAKAVWTALTNEKGFGVPVYDPDGSPDKIALDVVAHLAKSNVPWDTIVTAWDKLHGKTSAIENDKLVGNMTGFGYSQGHPQGPAAGMAAEVEERIKAQRLLAMEEVKRLLKYDNEEKAREKLEAIGLSPREVTQIIKRIEQPAEGMTRGQRKRFNQHSTEEDQQRMDRVAQ